MGRGFVSKFSLASLGTRSDQTPSRYRLHRKSTMIISRCPPSAEGSHPNKTMSRYTWECKTKEESDCEDDPNSQNKLEDPVK
ncbi:chondroitin sulfate proteoglycan 5 isoform X4, partial [Lates japonicus]